MYFAQPSFYIFECCDMSYAASLCASKKFCSKELIEPNLVNQQSKLNINPHIWHYPTKPHLFGIHTTVPFYGNLQIYYCLYCKFLPFRIETFVILFTKYKPWFVVKYKIYMAEVIHIFYKSFRRDSLSEPPYTEKLLKSDFPQAKFAEIEEAGKTTLVAEKTSEEETTLVSVLSTLRTLKY